MPKDIVKKAKNKGSPAGFYPYNPTPHPTTSVKYAPFPMPPPSPTGGTPTSSLSKFYDSDMGELTSPSPPASSESDVPVCLYCDQPLPPHPTAKLSQLLSSTALSPSSDAVARLCRLHHLEAEVLPNALSRGYPQSINWLALHGRVEEFLPHLKAILLDTSSTPEGARARCRFWQLLLKRILAAGGVSKAFEIGPEMSAVRDYWVGYYGEKGRAVLTNLLFKNFPQQQFKDHTDPVSWRRFIECVFVTR
ncbi:hypothetical protein FB45DRAFT_1133677 [Roridomyces roridus]|uniref:Uncharacterized protein n=1 Tax=Roridomyces roridus TaxID=1738132 RepID=A0AAD7FTY7_9AGAR|nr:hypothetical protein FB45DRAFT_1133677 [Roridomyces roridus]